MSSATPTLAAIRRRTLNLYDAVTFLMLAGIGALAGYVLWFVNPIGPLVCAAQGGTTCSPAVNPLITPGGEESLGLALSLMFLMAALIFHLVDRTYRVWPLGRKVTPPVPAPITDESHVLWLRVLVVLVAAGACAYLLGSLLAS